MELYFIEAYFSIYFLFYFTNMSLSERLKYAEMKARHSKIFLPWYKKFWGKLIIVILTFLLLLFTLSAIYVYQEIKRIQAEEAGTYSDKQKQAYLELINGSGGYTIGAPNPKITLVEFTDFACPYCRQAALEIRPLLENYKDDVKLVIRDFPVHENSIDLALAMRCAGEQGRYWEAYDLTFQEQELLTDTGDLLKANLLAWAEILNLDLGRFETCFDERRYVSLIRRDYEDGLALQIQGTPTWFVNNYPITGYYPDDKFKELFDGILKELKSPETSPIE
jgi:protein-disulfide isomerase